MKKLSIFQALIEDSRKALDFAKNAHSGQTRSGGAPYISHPIRVAQSVQQYKKSHNLDALISAAYLHDTIEDTHTTHEDLEKLFGGLVASIVKELTSDKDEINRVGKTEYLSKKMAAMTSYALVIKLADRLDNVQDIATAKTPEWRKRYKEETEKILSYIENNRVLSGTHRKLISLIRDKLNEVPTQSEQLTEAQVFNWDRFRPDIIKYVNAKLNGKQAANPFYDIIVNRPQVGSGQKLGFDPKLAQSWKDYFSGKSFNTDGVWSQIDLNRNLPRKSGNDRTYNYYITVAKDKKNIAAFINGIPKLFEIMKRLSDSKQSPISFKTHRLLDAFVDHNDSLKVYYYDSSLQSEVEAAVKKWVSEAGIQIATRSHTHGVDVKGTDGGSFGQLLSNQVTKQVDAVISQYGKKYTAEQYFEWIKKNMDGIIKSVQVDRK